MSGTAIGQKYSTESWIYYMIYTLIVQLQDRKSRMSWEMAALSFVALKFAADLFPEVPDLGASAYSACRSPGEICTHRQQLTWYCLTAC